MTCEWCRKDFVARNRPERDSKPRFCSRPCFVEWKHAQVVWKSCEQCGSQFRAIPTRLEKGQSRFCSVRCRADATPAGNAKYLTVDGRFEHCRIAERALGRPLPEKAHVHHVNGDGRDNRNKNLVICQDAAYHKFLHVRQRVISAGGDPNTQRICGTCRKPKDFDKFTSYPSGEIRRRCSDCLKRNGKEAA